MQPLEDMPGSHKRAFLAFFKPCVKEVLERIFIGIFVFNNVLSWALIFDPPRRICRENSRELVNPLFTIKKRFSKTVNVGTSEKRW